jgi:hypothetical protein
LDDKKIREKVEKRFAFVTPLDIVDIIFLTSHN